MQRINQIENPIEKSLILREKIIKDYFEPFIISLKKSKLNEFKVIREIFCCLQMEVADSQFYFDFPQLMKEQKCQLLYNFDNTIQRKSLKPLILYPELKGNFIRLGMLYLEEDKQKKEFPNSDSVEIQTCIREIF